MDVMYLSEDDGSKKVNREMLSNVKNHELSIKSPNIVASLERSYSDDNFLMNQ